MISRATVTAIAFIGAGACASPGGPYSDLAVATFGDPDAEAGIAGAVTVKMRCAGPHDGTYAAAFVRATTDAGAAIGTCGDATGSYVNGASVSASPFCPHGAGSVTSETVTTEDGGSGCAVVTTLSRCVISPDTTVDSLTEVGTWSPDDSVFRGELTIAATTDGKPCNDSYKVTLTRQ